MERGANLASLTEEEEEDDDVPEDDGGSWTSSEGDAAQDDEQGDGGVRRGEPNKFDGLCDGVLSSLSLVQASLKELLELKDELLKHALPPNVQMKVALCTTKVFRSVSDMNQPASELVRLVHIYSTPWEEKSAALKKLHDDYNSKKAQLNIALKKLEMIDAQSKRIEKERRIMNWEKLFARLTTARGHGRRWKFLIETFKEKAKQGIEPLERYVSSMERSAYDSDPEQEEEVTEDREVETQVQQVPQESEQSEAAADAEHSDEEGEEEHDDTEHHEDEHHGSDDDTGDEDDDDEDESHSKGYKDSEVSSVVSSPRKEEKEKVPTYVRPPMKDKECWTHQPEFDRYLYLRVYQPEGLEVSELKCSLRFGKQSHKTQLLDEPPQEEDSESVKDEKEEPAGDVESQMSRRPPRGRLIGMRGGRPRAARTDSVREGSRRKSRSKFEQCCFTMPDEEPPGIWKPRSHDTSAEPTHLKISVLHGPREQMTAMATVDMDDLRSLDLPVFYLPPPTGDDPLATDVIVADPANSLHSMSQESLHSIASSGSEADSVRAQSKAFDPSNRLVDLDPVKFPLYSVHAAGGDAMHLPSGQLPLIGFWVKKPRPLTFSRATDPQESITNIVLDETGFDLRLVTREELHPETRDQSVSPVCVTPEPQEPVEETVPKTQYEKLAQIHEEDMMLLQQEYEDRLQELADSLQEMQDAQLAPPGHLAPRSRPTSSGSRSLSPSRSQSPGGTTRENMPRPPKNKATATEPATRRRRPIRLSTRTLPNWGETLPKNFFDRLRMFEEESSRHKQELNEKTYKETSELLEKRLAGEFKLSNPTDEDIYDALQDVSLPAVFMPTKVSNNINIYNPRAAKYFHPTGASGMRLTQPPSMVQLPPLPKNKISVVNLFDLSRNFTRDGTNDWLMKRYLAQEQGEGGVKPDTPEMTRTPVTPPPTNLTRKTRESTLLQSAPPQKEAVCD